MVDVIVLTSAGIAFAMGQVSFDTQTRARNTLEGRAISSMYRFQGVVDLVAIISMVLSFIVFFSLMYFWSWWKSILLWAIPALSFAVFIIPVMRIRLDVEARLALDRITQPILLLLHSLVVYRLYVS